MSSQSFRITLLLIAPVSAVYAMAFLKDAIRHMYDIVEDDSHISMTFSLLSIIFSTFFGLLVIYNLYSFKIGAIQDPDDLKDRLAMIEVAAGGFLGIIFETLFSGYKQASNPSASRTK
ncbi:hypothetical protein [Methylobacterium marchantiae]|uniref:MotA/TolQ/ExbB proton channel domain-containing protein n=1 Tax=Methylobacterium marchantiae TaxID=600331 RepID=A0ABW3X2K7_9HYPH